MKVLALGAVVASLFGVSNVNITMDPDAHHWAEGSCLQQAYGEDNFVTSTEIALCEMQSAFPFDSIQCLASNLNIRWRRVESDPVEIIPDVEADYVFEIES